MTSHIKPGQVYVACAPIPSEPQPRYRRIRVVAEPITTWGRHGCGKVTVETVLPDGRGIRRRVIETSQLHPTAITKDGTSRRGGYALQGEVT